MMNIDPTFDDNYLIKETCVQNEIELFEILFKNDQVKTSVDLKELFTIAENNYSDSIKDFILLMLNN